jgi:hypothetical protein
LDAFVKEKEKEIKSLTLGVQSNIKEGEKDRAC